MGPRGEGRGREERERRTERGGREEERKGKRQADTWGRKGGNRRWREKRGEKKEGGSHAHTWLLLGSCWAESGGSANTKHEL